MIVYYENNDKLTRKIWEVEHGVMTPSIPYGYSIAECVEYYKGRGLSFVSLPYELHGEIWEYDVCVNEQGEFIGLKPIAE